MLVFRIENAAGVGAYRAYGEPHPDTGSQPTPYSDGKLAMAWAGLHDDGVNKDYYFGFGSLNQLRRWFHCEDWRRTAHEAGLHVSVYKIDPLALHPTERETRLAYRGSKQVIFRKASAQHLRSIPLTDI